MEGMFRDLRPPLQGEGLYPITPYTAEEARLWHALNPIPNIKLNDLDQIFAIRRANRRERMDAVFGRRVDPSEDTDPCETESDDAPPPPPPSGTKAEAGDPLVEMSEVGPATESSTLADSGTAAGDPLAENAEEGPVPKRPRKDFCPLSEENVIPVTDSSDAAAGDTLAENAEGGPVPKRPRKDLGPTSEENVIPVTDS